MTLEVIALGGTSSGFDPYTIEAFEERTKLKCTKASFEDIINGIIEPPEKKYSCVIISFALHLLDESLLPAFCFTINQFSDTLIILTPHKKPHLKEEWGWNLITEEVENRVRMRRYKVKENQIG